MQFLGSNEKLITHYADDTDFISTDYTDGCIWTGYLGSDTHIWDTYHLQINADMSKKLRNECTVLD
jgi:hypothetical protein